MPKNKIKMLHLRGRNGSQYARIGVYSGGELPKEYHGVSKIFDANPNVQEVTLVAQCYDTHTTTWSETEENVFKRVEEDAN